MNNPISSSVVLILSLLFSQILQADTLYDGRFKSWTIQAEQGKARAQYKLGNAYLRGNEVDVDLDMALKWFKAAAKQGHAKAEYKLGYLYYLGKGVKKNTKKAFKYLKLSAEREYSPAQFYLGKLYAAGEGTARDYDAAISWMEKARADNYGPADAELRRIKKARDNSRNRSVKAASTSRPKAKSKTREKSAKKRKSSSKQSLEQVIVSALWHEKGKPSEHLPSDVNSCETKNDKIVCQSINLNRSTDFAEITYSVETSIWGFKKSGKFLASYQVNNHFVLPEDPDDPNPSIEDVPVTGMGSTIKMRCKLKKDNISCITDNLEKHVYQQVETDNYE